MSLTLRPYQTALIDQCRAAMQAGSRRVLLQLPTGSGKTITIAQMLASAAARGKRAWFCVHRKELLDQSVATFIESADIHTGVVAAGYSGSPLAPVQVCSVPSLARRCASLAPPDLVVWDECFVAGTKIGTKAIETIQKDDIVTTWNGMLFDRQRVAECIKTKAPAVLFVVHSGPQSVVCTAGHPFLTIDGRWIRAWRLRVGDSLHGVCNMRRSDQTQQQSQSTLCRLLSIYHGQSQSTRCTGTNANAQSDGERRDARTDDDDAQAHRTQAAISWWQRCAVRACRGLAGIGTQLAERSHNWNRQRLASEGVVNALQDRHWASSFKNRYRSGRRFTWDALTTRRRSKERIVSEIRRVDRIEVLERGRNQRYDEVCPDGYVYNFETENTHTYIANGFVVHNCHHLASASWSALAAQFPHARHIGLTATPLRLDGRGLGTYFDTLLVGPSTAELMQAGYLSRYQYFAPTLTDLSAVHRVAGDYNKREVSHTMQHSTVVGDAVSHYQQHGGGGRALVFAWSIEASKDIAASFMAAGIEAAHVDGETNRGMRTTALRRFRNGTLRVLCNVDLFGEGLDVPAVDCVFLLRPTASLGLYLQQVGRGLRPARAKTHVRIFDHVNNWQRHGLPDDPRTWTLTGDKAARRTSEPMGKRCGVCFGVSRVGAVRCALCGVPFPVQAREVTQVKGELQAVDVDVLRQLGLAGMGAPVQARPTTIDEWKALGAAKGYKSKWAYVQWSMRRRA